MALHDNTYSRFVAIAKVALPLFALGVLSTVFLIAKPIDPSNAIPFADVNVEELARERGMSSPEYSGITSDGAAISISAETAKPDPEIGNDRIFVKKVHAIVELEDGGNFDIQSTDGTLNRNRQKASLTGGVLIKNDQGYTMRSQTMDASLADTELETLTPVTAEGPLGTLSAGQMKLSYDNEMYLLVFQKGVKVIYDPKG